MLEAMLGLKRASGSVAEASAAAHIVRRFINHLHSIDEAGNLLFVVGSSQTLFTAHIDTVHHSGGVNLFSKIRGNYYAQGVPLGADDAAGIEILAHLMRNKVPGWYLFTRGEECGGVGAKYFAENNAQFLSTIKRAVAFDRRGYDSIITHQIGQESCSQEFALKLATRLGMTYKPDPTGVYTDTAEFIGIVGQCTNISVGYFNEHTSSEWLDMKHFNKLKEAVLKVDWESLPSREAIHEEAFWGSSWVDDPEALIEEENYFFDLVDDAMMFGKVEGLQEFLGVTKLWPEDVLQSTYDMNYEDAIEMLKGYSEC